MPEEQHDPIDAAARAGKSAEAVERADRDALKKSRAEAEAERRRERSRGVQAVELADDGRTITIQHTAGKVLQSSPLGILALGMALFCFYWGVRLLGFALEPATLEAPGARTMYLAGALPCALAGAGAAFLWHRFGSRPSLVIRVTDEGNVGLLAKGKLITVGRNKHYYFSIIRRARVWGRVRWVGKCSVSAFGEGLTGPNVYGRRVFGVTEDDVRLIQAFVQRHDINITLREFGSTGGQRSYEDRGLWA